MIAALAVAIGAGIGATIRYLISMLKFEWRNLVIANMIGSFAAGAFAAVAPPTNLLLFLVVGVCGGLTSFSSFALDTIEAPYGRRQVFAAHVGVAIGGASCGFLAFNGVLL